MREAGVTDMHSVEAARNPRNSRLASDLTILIVVGLVLVVALAAGGASLYKQFYSPSAFVERYLGLIANGDAADALRIPGVAIEHTQLESAGISAQVSDALLRRTTLGTLTKIKITDELKDGDEFVVTASYLADGVKGTSTFRVEQRGWVGLIPEWQFSQSPLSVIELTLRGSEQFIVNGFEVDRRQVAVEGIEVAALAPVPMLVFSPGVYSFSVDTPISRTPGVRVLADVPLKTVPLDLQADPTDQFIEVVRTRVVEFLTQCTEQQVLQPTGCPFGMRVNNYVTEPPTWTVTTMPEIEVVPDGANWKIPPASAVAHIDVEVQSLFDGTLTEVSEDVPFEVDGTVTMLPDGTAWIRVGAPAASGTS